MTASEQLAARAAVWAWAARTFSYPTDALLAALRAASDRERLATAAATADPTGALTSALAAAWAVVDGPDDGPVSLESEHTFLFGRHVRVPPYESSYVLERGADRSTHLAEVGGLYAAFGLQVSAARPEMPDHLGAECELAAALLAKEAYALSRGWTSRARLTRRARRKLIVDHLQRWLPAFAERLEKHHRLPHYPAFTEVLLHLLAVEERVLDAPRRQLVTAGSHAGVP